MTLKVAFRNLFLPTCLNDLLRCSKYCIQYEYDSFSDVMGKGMILVLGIMWNFETKCGGKTQRSSRVKTDGTYSKQCALQC